MNDLLASFNSFVSDLSSEYKLLLNSKSGDIVKECFEAIFKMPIESQLSGISNRVRDLIEFLAVTQLLEELEKTVELINKYRIAYSVQELFKHIDGTFTLPESNQYKIAKQHEKILKQKLHRHGIPSELINKYFNTALSKGEKHIPTRNAKESYAQYLKRALGLSYGDFEEMMKVYKQITPQKDWRLYDNIKLLVVALRTNGVMKTANQIYEYLE